MGSFISGGFLKPIMLVGRSNFITGGKDVSITTYIQFITSLGENFITSDGYNFKVKQ